MMGLGIAAVVVTVYPELSAVIAVASLIGAVFPDLDMPFEHRKTLHFPVYYSLVGVIALPFFVLMPSTLTASVAFFFLNAGIHSLVDYFGCGLEPRPWEATNDQAVYVHYTRQWLAPRRWVRYDGAPEDLYLTLLMGIPLLMIYTGPMKTVIAATILVGALYTMVRRNLQEMAPEFILKRF